MQKELDHAQIAVLIWADYTTAQGSARFSKRWFTVGKKEYDWWLAVKCTATKDGEQNGN